ncbi:MAG: LON peptidase substrate-binding domain-containing protein [Casimicrobiaceae bacterium]
MLTGLFTGMGRSREITLPVFPLKTVLFPGGLLPIRVFETRYMEMVKVCLKDDKAFGICSITTGHEVGAGAEFAAVGTVAKITSWDMPQLGILNLVASGGSRFNVLEREVSGAGLALAHGVLLREEDPEAAADPAPMLVELLQKLIARVGEEHFSDSRHFDDANWVSYRLAEILPIKLSVKQKLLEVNDSEVRLRVIAEFLKLQGVIPR